MTAHTIVLRTTETGASDLREGNIGPTSLPPFTRGGPLPARLKPLSAGSARWFDAPGSSRPPFRPLRLAHHFQVEDRAKFCQLSLDPLQGTSTLFAAFEVATGKVTAAHKTRRRRIEFLDFMLLNPAAPK